MREGKGEEEGQEEVDGAEQESRRLPPGSHGIPADVVARNQRERLVAAMAEVCSESGYAGATAGAVAKTAGVSTVTFYKQFDGKLDCMLAAHEQLSERLLEGVDGSSAPLGAMLALLAGDPPSGRLLTVEILAAGPEGVERHAAMVEQLARRLDAEWVPVAGVLALIGRLVSSGEAARLPELEDELAATFLAQS